MPGKQVEDVILFYNARNAEGERLIGAAQEPERGFPLCLGATLAAPRVSTLSSALTAPRYRLG